ncbi:EspA/EspE family type VII secretion system effector [Mycobacterium sp. 050134]|uniref:EspA/EspE family type VII secretion system effector n=1 Tax=Mycobacterium sp. 050134 TaxID=3096111 RepID=UPI002ED91F85
MILLALAAVVSAGELAALWVPFGLGLSTPYEGDCLEKRSQCFAQVASLLSHGSVPGWTGSAAGAYSDIVGQLISAAGELAKHDAKVANLVKDQAAMVGEAQLGLTVEQDVLIAALPLILALECKPQCMPIAYGVALLLAGAAIGGAITLLIRCLAEATNVQKSVDQMGYQVPSFPTLDSAIGPGITTGVQIGRVGMESDEAGRYSGFVAGGDVTATASMSRRVGAGLAAVESSGVDVRRAGVVGAACGPRLSGRSANGVEAGASLRDHSPVRGPRTASVRDGSAGSAHVAGAAGVSSGKRAPVNAGLAAALGDADSCGEDLVRA